MTTMAAGSASAGTSSTFDLDKYSVNYDMDAEKKLVAYIFSNETFENSNLKFLKGSSNDAIDLKDALKKLGFSNDHIKVYKDKTADEMRNALKMINETELNSNIGCFICAIISHGCENEMIVGSHSETVGLYELLSYLTPEKCPFLTGAPKLFFIATCRGKKIDEGVWIAEGPETEVNETLINIPIMPDLLVFHASFYEYKSYMRRTEGSWLMQALSKFLTEYGTKYEILTLLTAVSNYVASFETNRKHPEMPHRKQMPHLKQMPQIVSTLLKELKFEARN